MIVDIRCPHCGGKVDADYVLESDRVVCPHCSVLLVGSQDETDREIDDALLDPSDPAGYLNNFPPEDDY